MSSNLEDTKVGRMWDKLLELGVSEQTLQVVIDINGYKEQTMLDVLYASTGYRNFEQLDSEAPDNDEYDDSIERAEYNAHPECRE